MLVLLACALLYTSVTATTVQKDLVQEALAVLADDIAQLVETHFPHQRPALEEDDEIMEGWSVEVDGLENDELFLENLFLGEKGIVIAQLKRTVKKPMVVTLEKGTHGTDNYLRMEIALAFQDSFFVEYAPFESPDGTKPGSMKVHVSNLDLDILRLKLTAGRATQPTIFSFYNFKDLDAKFHSGYQIVLKWQEAVLFISSTTIFKEAEEERDGFGVAFLPGVGQQHELRSTRHHVSYKGSAVGSLKLYGVDKGFSTNSFRLVSDRGELSCDQFKDLNVMAEAKARERIIAQKNRVGVSTDNSWLFTLTRWIPNVGAESLACIGVKKLEAFFSFVGERPRPPTAPLVIPDHTIIRVLEFERAGVTTLAIRESAMTVMLKCKSIKADIMRVDGTTGSFVRESEETHKATLSKSVEVIFSMRDDPTTNSRGLTLYAQSEPLEIKYEKKTRASSGEMEIQWNGISTVMELQQGLQSSLGGALSPNADIRVLRASNSLAQFHGIRLQTGTKSLELQVERTRIAANRDAPTGHIARLQLSGLRLTSAQHNIVFTVEQTHGRESWVFSPPAEKSFDNRFFGSKTYRDAISPVESSLCRKYAEKEGPKIAVSKNEGITLIPAIVGAVLDGILSFILSWILGRLNVSLGSAKNIHDIICFLLSNKLFNSL